MNFQLRLILAPVGHLPIWKKLIASLYIAIAGPFYIAAAVFLRARLAFQRVQSARLRKEFRGSR